MRTILRKPMRLYEEIPLAVSRGFDIAATISNELVTARCPDLPSVHCVESEFETAIFNLAINALDPCIAISHDQHRRDAIRFL